MLFARNYMISTILNEYLGDMNDIVSKAFITEFIIEIQINFSTRAINLLNMEFTGSTKLIGHAEHIFSSFIRFYETAVQKDGVLNGFFVWYQIGDLSKIKLLP